MHAHPLPLAGAERPALVPDRVRDAEPAEAVHEPGAAQGRAPRSSASPSRRRRRGRELGDGAGVAERVRRLEVDEVGDRQQRGVELLVGQHDRERRLGVDDRGPGADRVETAEDRPQRASQSAAASVGSNCVPRVAAASATRGVDTADAVRDLDVLGELRDPRRRAGSSLAARSPGQPLPSHCS